MLAIRQKLADENPAVADFRNRLADSHTGIGWLLMQMGKPADAVGEFSREEAIRTRLVQESPSTTQLSRSPGKLPDERRNGLPPPRQAHGGSGALPQGRGTA